LCGSFSVYRTKTHYGFSVTALVFACLTLIGGIGVLISFGIISHSTIPEIYSHSYSYYSAYSGYSYHYTDAHQYGSWGEHNGFAVVATAGGLIMIGEILAVIFSSFEIRRVPPSLKNPMIIQQYPMMVPQQDYYPQISPPPTYAYSMNNEAPAYSSVTVQV